MPKFGRRSFEVRNALHPDLMLIFDTVIQHFDCSLIEGYRPKERQDMLFEQGFSDVKWPNGKHNVSPSLAVDAMPWHQERPHIDWAHSKSITHLAGFVRGVAVVLFSQRRITHLIRWGGDWDRDFDVRERQAFNDSPHYELYLPERGPPL